MTDPKGEGARDGNAVASHRILDAREKRGTQVLRPQITCGQIREIVRSGDNDDEENSERKQSRKSRKRTAGTMPENEPIPCTKGGALYAAGLPPRSVRTACRM